MSSTVRTKVNPLLQLTPYAVPSFRHPVALMCSRGLVHGRIEALMATLATKMHQFFDACTHAID